MTDPEVVIIGRYILNKILFNNIFDKFSNLTT